MHLSQAFGGLSVILVGDIAHLSPAGDKPLFHSLQKSDKQIQGHLIYQEFKQVVTLSVIIELMAKVMTKIALGHVMENPL